MTLERPSRAGVIALIVGLVVTAALTLTALALYDRNESRLLKLSALELSSLLSAAVPTVQTPLVAAAELADSTGGNAQRFRAFMAPEVGAGRQFQSASLWRLGVAHPTPTAVIGGAPVLASLPAQAQQFFARAKGSSLLSVTGILASKTPALGYLYAIPGVGNGFAAYAEGLLPKNRRSRIASGSGFSDLNYVLYLGRSRSHTDLLLTSLRHFPISGRQVSEVVPFGDSAFTLVVSPRESLGGAFFHSLPWIIAGVGVLLTLAAALITDRLARRRAHAEQLAVDLDRVASENERMYTEQRGIAQTLQHALLPDALPELEGLRVSARYVPAASEIDVGGDWYDVVEVDDHGVLLLIGDVSGHGLRAATTMAALRHAALAYAVQDSAPATVLAKLSAFVNSGEHDYFATVLCALIDVRRHTVTVASAGHMAPLLIDGDGGRYVEFHVDVPIGVASESRYHEALVTVPAHATLVAFTDGLVERRGEVLDVGLERLREAATGADLELDELLSSLALELASAEHHDDTAIVGIQWQN
jgi:serine phosphatase RsbU (regulator of sigma subunit)